MLRDHHHIRPHQHHSITYNTNIMNININNNNNKETTTIARGSAKILVNTESYVDRSSRRASRAAWKQSQCIASGQVSAVGQHQHQQSAYYGSGGFSSQQSLNRAASSLGHGHHQSSAVSISSGSVSSIASSLATSGHTGRPIASDICTFIPLYRCLRLSWQDHTRIY